MLYILFILGVVLAVVGVLVDDSLRYSNNPFIPPGAIMIFVSVISIIICWGSYNFNKNTLQSRLEVLEEQNTIVLAQVGPVVQKAMEFESNTYKDLKLDSNNLIALSNMYPNLKDNTFIQTQLQIIIENQTEIKRLKLTEAKLKAYRFWIWNKKE